MPVVGGVELRVVTEEDLPIFFEHWIDRRFWGKGIATAALSAFLDHVKVRPLYAHVAEHNVASIRVLEKCGFTITGHDRTPPSERGVSVNEVVLRLD
jgi:RimJ/RimL family protein N-acetyltransferase